MAKRLKQAEAPVHTCPASQMMVCRVCIAEKATGKVKAKLKQQIVRKSLAFFNEYDTIQYDTNLNLNLIQEVTGLVPELSILLVGN